MSNKTTFSLPARPLVVMPLPTPTARQHPPSSSSSSPAASAAADPSSTPLASLPSSGDPEQGRSDDLLRHTRKTSQEEKKDDRPSLVTHDAPKQPPADRSTDADPPREERQGTDEPILDQAAPDAEPVEEEDAHGGDVVIPQRRDSDAGDGLGEDDDDDAGIVAVLRSRLLGSEEGEVEDARGATTNVDYDDDDARLDEPPEEEGELNVREKKSGLKQTKNARRPKSTPVLLSRKSKKSGSRGIGEHNKEEEEDSLMLLEALRGDFNDDSDELVRFQSSSSLSGSGSGRSTEEHQHQPPSSSSQEDASLEKWVSLLLKGKEEVEYSEKDEEAAKTNKIHQGVQVLPSLDGEWISRTKENPHSVITVEETLPSSSSFMVGWLIGEGEGEDRPPVSMDLKYVSPDSNTSTSEDDDFESTTSDSSTYTELPGDGSAYDFDVSSQESQSPKDALTMLRNDTPNTKYWTCKRWCLSMFQSLVFCSIALAAGMGKSVIGVALPLLSKRMNVTDTVATWLLVSGVLGALVGSPVSGYLFEAIKRRDGDDNDTVRKCPRLRRFFSVTSITIVALVVLGGLLVSVPFIRNFWVLFVINGVAGIAVSALFVSVGTSIGWVWREKVYAPMQALHAFESVGPLLAPILFAASIRLTGGEGDDMATRPIPYDPVFWLMMIAAAVLFVVSIPLICLPVPQEAELVVEEDKVRMKKKGVCKRCLGSVFSVSTLIYVCLGFMVGMQEVEMDCFGALIPIHAAEHSIGTVVSRSYLGASFWGSVLLSRFAFVFISIIIPDFYIVSFSVIGNVATFITINVFPGSPVAVWVCTCLHGFFTGPLEGTLFSLPQSFFKLPVSSTSVAVTLAVGSLGFVVDVAVSSMWSVVPHALLIVGGSVFLSMIPVVLILLCLRLCSGKKWKEKWAWVSSGSAGSRRTMKEIRLKAGQLLRLEEESEKGRGRGGVGQWMEPLLAKNDEESSLSSDEDEDDETPVQAGKGETPLEEEDCFL